MTSVWTFTSWLVLVFILSRIVELAADIHAIRLVIAP